MKGVPQGAPFCLIVSESRYRALSHLFSLFRSRHDPRELLIPRLEWHMRAFRARHLIPDDAIPRKE